MLLQIYAIIIIMSMSSSSSIHHHHHHHTFYIGPQVISIWLFRATSWNNLLPYYVSSTDFIIINSSSSSPYLSYNLHRATSLLAFGYLELLPSWNINLPPYYVSSNDFSMSWLILHLLVKCQSYITHCREGLWWDENQLPCSCILLESLQL